MTEPQRLDSIASGMINGTPTNGQLNKIADGYLRFLSKTDYLQMFGVVKASLTNAQKAQVAVTIIKNIIRETVKVSPKQVGERNISTIPEGDSSDL